MPRPSTCELRLAPVHALHDTSYLTQLVLPVMTSTFYAHTYQLAYICSKCIQLEVSCLPRSVLSVLDLRS